MNKKALLLLALFTLIGFSLIGVLVMYIFHPSKLELILDHGMPWHLQILIGLAYGTLTGWTARSLIASDFMTPVREKYAGLLGNISLSPVEIIFISLCAGIGEEMLFRAALQPLLGLWFTSILFVALHGYLSPNDLRLSAYGVALTVVIAGIGVLFITCGIITAMVSHAMIDIILLFMMDDEADTPRHSTE